MSSLPRRAECKQKVHLWWMRRPFYKLALQKICDCWKGARSLLMLMMQRRSLKRVVTWRDPTPTQTLAHYVNACTLHCAPHDQVESLRNTVKLGRASEWRKSDIGSCQNIKYSHSLTHFPLLELKRNTSDWRARRQTKGVAKRVQGFAQRDFSSRSLLSTAAGTWSDSGLFITIEAVLHFRSISFWLCVMYSKGVLRLYSFLLWQKQL